MHISFSTYRGKVDYESDVRNLRKHLVESTCRHDIENDIDWWIGPIASEWTLLQYRENMVAISQNLIAISWEILLNLFKS